MSDSLKIDIKKFNRLTQQLETADDIKTLHSRVSKLQAKFSLRRTNGVLNKPSNGFSRISRQFLVNELRQIGETRTLERALYYIRRLRKALLNVKMNSINDINLHRWKEYDNILTDSLWVLNKRDSSGPHSAWYWGNFIPQIPNQLMLRYTKIGEWVLDPFAGSGTTLIESRRLGRNCLGVELQPSIARKTRSLLKKSSDKISSTTTALEIGDSTTVDFTKLLRKNGAKSVQLAILHPPYHDIIKFSKKRNDLSNAITTKGFADKFGEVVDNITSVLDHERYLAVIIGDKYEKGEWIPLGFLLMQEVLKREYRLKSIVVKNFEETLGKRNQKELWRYRALAGGFYVFKHEYILIFQKTEKGGGKASPQRTQSARRKKD